VIVLIVGEHQLLVDDSFAEELDELGARMHSAVELDDEVAFRSALAELSRRVRSIGRPVAAVGVREFDLLVPPMGATLDEARRLLTDKALPLQAGLVDVGLGEASAPRTGDPGVSAIPDLVVRTRSAEHTLHGGKTYRIGRDPKSDIVVADSRVSWRHGVLRAEGDGWLLEDVGSTNGTFVGLQRIDRVPIAADCVVRLGNPDDGPVLRCMPQAGAAFTPAAPVEPAALFEAAPPFAPAAPSQASPEPAPPRQAPPPVSDPQGTGSFDAVPWQAPYPDREPSSTRHVGPAGAAMPAASEGVQSAAYDNLVRRAFAELVRQGRLLFNPPDRMRLGQTERVEVRLTRTLTLDAELLQHLRGHGEPQLEEIPTAPLMAVTLKGDGFRITAYSDEEQSVTPGGITMWEFDIRAIKRGQQRLVICVSLRIPMEGRPLEHKSIPVREATIDVQVGAPALVGHFVASNWQWFIGTVIAIAAVLVAVLH
jgi:hypothetical protein